MDKKILNELVEAARSVQGKIELDFNNYAGFIGVAMLAENGKIYKGIDIGVTCGIGFCAEHNAISTMLMDGETRILHVVAVGDDSFFPPCGRCRELMFQINRKNIDTDVILGWDKIMKLGELLPQNFWLNQEKI